MRELALFAGAGGGLLGSTLLGWRTVCAVEIDPYCRKVLHARQLDGSLAQFPVHNDVCTFDGKPWCGYVDVISGGFPCQDISSAGKRAGIAGARSGLWKQFVRIIGEVKPQFAFIENSPMLVRRGLNVVLHDLASLGYDAEWDIISAAAVGAPHLRERIWILAYANSSRFSRNVSESKHGDAIPFAKQTGQVCFLGGAGVWSSPTQRPAAPFLMGVGNGVANFVDRVRAIGNGQVPAVVRLAWNRLYTSI